MNDTNPTPAVELPSESDKPIEKPIEKAAEKVKKAEKPVVKKVKKPAVKKVKKLIAKKVVKNPPKNKDVKRNVNGTMCISLSLDVFKQLETVRTKLGKSRQLGGPLARSKAITEALQLWMKKF